MVLLEAITLGLPIITVANCGYEFHVQKARAGIVLSEPYQQTDLNRALFDLLDQEHLHKTFRENALNYAQQTDFYSLTETAMKHIEKN